MDVDSDSDGFEMLPNPYDQRTNSVGQVSADSDDDIDAEDLLDAAVELLSGSSSDSGEVIDSIAVHHTLCPMIALLVTQRVLKDYDTGKHSRDDKQHLEWIKQLAEGEDSLESQRHHLDEECKCSMNEVLENHEITSTLDCQNSQCQPAETLKAIQDEVRKVFRNLPSSELSGVLFNVTLSPTSRADNNPPSVVSFVYLIYQTAGVFRFLGLEAAGGEDGKPALRSTASMERAAAGSYATSQLLQQEPFQSFDAYFVTLKPSEEPPAAQPPIVAPTLSTRTEEAVDSSMYPMPSTSIEVASALPVNPIPPTSGEVASASPVNPIPPTSGEAASASPVNPIPSTSGEAATASPISPMPPTISEGAGDLFVGNPESPLDHDEALPPYTELDEGHSSTAQLPPVNLPQSFGLVNDRRQVVSPVEEAARPEAPPVRPTPVPQEEAPPVPNPPQLQRIDLPPEAPTPRPAQKRKAPRKPSAQDWMFSLQNKSLILPSPVSPAREPTPPLPQPQQSPPASASLPKKPVNKDVSWMLALQSPPPVLPSLPAQPLKKASSPTKEDVAVKKGSVDKALKARKAPTFAKQAPAVASSSKLDDDSSVVKVYGAEQLGLLFGSGPRKRPAKASDLSSTSSGLKARGKTKGGADDIPVDEQSVRPRNGKDPKRVSAYENTDAWDSMLLEQELTANSSTKAKGKGKQRNTVLEPKESNYRALRNDFAWQVALAATSLKPSDDYLKEREERTKRIKVRLGQVPFDCLVCFEKIEWEDGARMTDCEHSFCKDCIEGHIQSKLDENQFPITCPVCLADRNRKTRGYVEEALIVDLALPEKLHDKFIELEIAQLSIKIECPGCKNSMQIAREDYLAEAFIWCPLPGCSRQFCRACREITNNGGKGHACKIDEALDELMQANGWRYCPGCRTPTQKVSGCNHMTCGAPGCSTHFCYTCGASIWDNRSARSLADCISTHYSTCVHFDVPNQAPNAPANGVNANANVNPLVARIRNRRRAAECFHQ